MAAIVAAGVVRKQKQVVASFQAAGATSADRATTAAMLGVHEGLAFARLRRNAVLRDAGGARLYLDESRWDVFVARRRRLAFLIPAIFVLVAVAVYLWITRG